MIKVIKDNDLITVKGHANMAEYGKDIVCASVSSIIYTSINAIASINPKYIDVQDDGNVMTIKIKENDEIVLKLIANMFEMLKSVAKDYPKNLSVKENA